MSSNSTELQTSLYDGEIYLDFIGILAAELQPNSYLEIGTHSGGSLAHVNCDAVCIDPNFVLAVTPTGSRRRTFFYQMGSDEFFASYDLKHHFSKGVDLAFLDGMHWFEFLLRDFINTEKNCHRNSLILMHDCMPPNLRIAEREWVLDESEDKSTQYGWCGDVWKILPILMEFRPELIVRILDCPPTGLVAVSGLDPSSEVLLDNYHKILDKYSSLTLAEYSLQKLHYLFPLIHTRAIKDASKITSYFTVR